MLDQLRPQDCLYGVLERSPAGTGLRVVGTVREVLSATDDHEALTGRFADPAVRIVSLTVTEKGYRHDPATGRLRTGDPGTAADLAGARSEAALPVIPSPGRIRGRRVISSTLNPWVARSTSSSVRSS